MIDALTNIKIGFRTLIILLKNTLGFLNRGLTRIFSPSIFGNIYMNSWVGPVPLLSYKNQEKINSRYSTKKVAQTDQKY